MNGVPLTFRDVAIEKQLYDAMRKAIADKPRPEGVSEQTYAATVFAAMLVGALRRAEEETAAHQAELAAKTAQAEANTRYWVVNYRLGLRTSCLRGEEKAFCAWAGIKRGDFDRLAAGKVADVDNWVRDNDRPQGSGAQLVAFYKPEATSMKFFAGRAPDPNKLSFVSLAPIEVDFRQMSLEEARQYGTRQRGNVPSTGIVASTY